MENIKNLMEFRSIGDAFEDHKGNLEFFSKFQ